MTREVLPTSILALSGKFSGKPSRRLMRLMEHETYAILAGGPKVIVRSRRYPAAETAELAAKSPPPKLEE